MTYQNPKFFQNSELHQRALTVAKKFREAESELIDLLQEIDTQKTFREVGYTSLFEYAVKALKLSEANASNFITVARKSKSVPELQLAINAGDLTVSKARKITPILTTENSGHWIEMAKTLSKPQLEKEVARVAPQTLTPERIKYVTADRLEFKIGISEEIMVKLKRA